MKYFKVTNINDSEDEFYVSSTLPDATSAQVLEIAELDPAQYEIVEITEEEYEQEINAEWGESFDPIIFDCEADEDWGDWDLED